MKYLFVLIFAFVSLAATAQSENPEVIRLMEQELKMIQKDLVGQELTSEQNSKLTKLLTVKAEKIYKVREGNMGKLEMSKTLTKINNEFDPAAIFSTKVKLLWPIQPIQLFLSAVRSQRNQTTNSNSMRGLLMNRNAQKSH